MKTQLPHPLITLAGLLVVLALLVIARETTLLPRTTTIVIAASFLIFFRWISRRSAKTMRERRQQELDQLKRTPIFHLDD